MYSSLSCEKVHCIKTTELENHKKYCFNNSHLKKQLQKNEKKVGMEYQGHDHDSEGGEREN